MTPGILAPPFFVAAGILVVSGAAKLRRPRAAAQAMYAAGIHGGEAGVRTLGALEIVAGSLALWRPAPAMAVAIAVLYLGFAGFVGFLKVARPAASSCGCAGDRDVPPNLVHIALDVTAAAVAVAVAVGGVPGLATYATSLGAGAAPVGVGLVGIGFLAAVAATEVPPAWNSYAAPPHEPGGGGRGVHRHQRADEALASAGIAVGHPSLWPGSRTSDSADPVSSAEPS